MRHLIAIGLLLGSTASVAAPIPTGQTWVLYRSGNLDNSPSVERDSAPTLRFANGRVTGNTGCNTLSATYLQQGDRLTFGAITTTRRACASKVDQTLETRYLNTLRDVQIVSVSGPVLLLATEDGRTLAYRQAK